MKAALEKILPEFKCSPWIQKDADNVRSSQRLFARMLPVLFEEGEITLEVFKQYLDEFLDAKKDADLFNWIVQKSSDLAAHNAAKHHAEYLKVGKKSENRKKLKRGEHTKLPKAFIIYVQQLHELVRQDHPKASRYQVDLILDAHLDICGIRGKFYTSWNSIETCLKAVWRS